MQTHRRMKRVLYLNTLNIRPLPRTKQHKTTKMKTKEMEKVASEKYDILGHNVESFFHWSDKDVWCDGYVAAMDEYASQFQQEWIPVEVRLPDTTRTNFITAKDLSGRIVFLDHKEIVWYHDGIGVWYSDIHLFKDKFPDLTIIAWQPIITPQPYNPTKS